MLHGKRAIVTGASRGIPLGDLRLHAWRRWLRARRLRALSDPHGVPTDSGAAPSRSGNGDPSARYAGCDVLRLSDHRRRRYADRAVLRRNGQKFYRTKKGKDCLNPGR